MWALDPICLLSCFCIVCLLGFSMLSICVWLIYESRRKTFFCVISDKLSDAFKKILHLCENLPVCVCVSDCKCIFTTFEYKTPFRAAALYWRPPWIIQPPFPPVSHVSVRCDGPLQLLFPSPSLITSTSWWSACLLRSTANDVLSIRIIAEQHELKNRNTLLCQMTLGSYPV